MAIEDIASLAAQSLDERNLRRRNWPMYRQFSIEVLQEMLRKQLSPDQRAEIEEYLLSAKRIRKAHLEADEKWGDFIEKSGVPIAVSVVTLGSWALKAMVVPNGLHAGINLLLYFVAAVVWIGFRYYGQRKVVTARQLMAMLGKVD